MANEPTGNQQQERGPGGAEPSQSLAAEAPPAAPPTVRGPIRQPPRRPVWPTVIGAMAVAFGVLGALSGVNSLVAPLVVSWSAKLTPAGIPTGAGLMRDYGLMMILSGIAALILGGFLVAGGIGLLKRRPWSARVVLTWALLKIPYVVCYTVLQAQVQAAQQAQMQVFWSSQGGGGPGGGPPVALVSLVTDVAGKLGLALTLLWGLALPVVMLCIFGQRAIRDQVRAWHAPAESFTTASTAPPPSA